MQRQIPVSYHAANGTEDLLSQVHTNVVVLLCSTLNATAAAEGLEEPAMDLSATFRQSMRFNVQGEHLLSHQIACGWREQSVPQEIVYCIQHCMPIAQSLHAVSLDASVHSCAGSCTAQIKLCTTVLRSGGYSPALCPICALHVLCSCWSWQCQINHRHA